jgi:hypothetical protein
MPPESLAARRARNGSMRVMRSSAGISARARLREAEQVGIEEHVFVNREVAV